MLQYIVGMVSAGNPVIHLFANDITPSDSTVLGDLTEVGASTGYTPITLVSSNWTTTQSVGVTTAIYSQETFVFTTDATSYGYYVTNTANQLLWLERYTNAPFEIPDGGGTISITAKLVLS
jgi:hypothetical protein